MSTLEKALNLHTAWTASGLRLLSFLWDQRRRLDKSAVALVPVGPNSSITIVFTLERAFNLDNCMICWILSGDIECRTEWRKVQIRHFLIDLGTVSCAPSAER